jgi:hypothetical protein
MDGAGNVATQATFCPIGDDIYAFCGNSDIWRYDIAADSWGASPYDSIPWYWPYSTYTPPPASGTHYMTESVVGPVADLGVALFCIPARWTMSGTTIARAFVWKP